MDGVVSKYQPTKVYVDLVVAIDRNRTMGIRSTNSLPWHYPEDMAFFKNLTTGPNKAVVMGTNTWNSLPVSKTGEKLPGRFKMVVTTKVRAPEINTVFLRHWELKQIRIQARLAGVNHVYLIGGAQLFNSAISDCETAYITHIDDKHEGNVKFPWDVFIHTFGGERTYKRLTSKLRVAAYVNTRYNKLVKSIYDEQLEKRRPYSYAESDRWLGERNTGTDRLNLFTTTTS